MLSSRGLCFICLDSKARLVLPLEIRRLLEIEKNGKILFSIGAVKKGVIGIRLARAPESVESRAYSRNVSYVEEK